MKQKRAHVIIFLRKDLRCEENNACDHGRGISLQHRGIDRVSQLRRVVTTCYDQEAQLSASHL